ncbi:MAG: hypothetical protein OJF51_000232 [Nitrospira sp.]|jgi:hypothetical protein|nr:MAG: hypothetical protein OJF51_000232 [Nitrospira sp.]
MDDQEKYTPMMTISECEQDRSGQAETHASSGRPMEDL